ncbi:hypothetical protein N9Y32_00535 [Candidatus Thioglobus sp.]|nr:hypothetical protein [Candidatus Thioglobus sp.]
MYSKFGQKFTCYSGIAQLMDDPGKANHSREKQLIPLTNTIIKPYYQAKVDIAVQLFNEIFGNSNAKLHKLEGAFFMWIWFPTLKISSEELYQNLKAKGVYIIPGRNFLKIL